MLFIVFGISKSFEYFQLHLELINYHTSQKYLHKKIQLGTKERWKERRSFAKERVLFLKRWAQAGARSFFGKWARARSPFWRAR